MENHTMILPWCQLPRRSYYKTKPPGLGCRKCSKNTSPYRGCVTAQNSRMPKIFLLLENPSKPHHPSPNHLPPPVGVATEVPRGLSPQDPKTLSPCLGSAPGGGVVMWASSAPKTMSEGRVCEGNDPHEGRGPGGNRQRLGPLDLRILLGGTGPE